MAFTVSAFIAGILTFLAPCTLPLLPAYLAFISGVDSDDLKKGKKNARMKILLNGLSFVIGFSIIFILFGTLAGLFGQTLAPFRIWLARIGGALVIIFGLYMLGAFNLKIFKGGNLKTPGWLKPGKPASSLAVGATFGFGWTPCIGPILGSILLLAGTTSTVTQGAFLLLVFSLGLAIPFMLIALLFGQATTYINKVSKYLGIISKIGGLFLILIGLLLVTNSFDLTIQYGYKIFDFIQYDRLLDYL